MILSFSLSVLIFCLSCYLWRKRIIKSEYVQSISFSVSVLIIIVIMIASMTISGNKIVVDDLNAELRSVKCESDYNCFNARQLKEQIQRDINETEDKIRELKRVVAWPF
jgi:membrane protein required for beta-lactamase induction